MHSSISAIAAAVVSAADMSERGGEQRKQQRWGMTGLARSVERTIGFRQGSLGITEQPQSQWSKSQDRRSHIMAKSRRQRTMHCHGRKARKRDRDGEPFSDVAHTQQGLASRRCPIMMGAVASLLLC